MKRTNWTKMSGTEIRCVGCGHFASGKPKNCPSVKHNEYYQRHLAIRRKIGIDVLIHYGGKCVCCGFSDLTKRIRGKRFLQIDHINGGGYRTGESGTDLARIVQKRGFPPEYRVLCAGCNISMEPGQDKCELHR